MLKELLPAIFGFLGVIIGGLITFWSTMIIENRKYQKAHEENKSRLIQDLVYNITFFAELSGEISLHKTMSNYYKATNENSDFDAVITELRTEEYKNRIKLLDLKSNISKLCTLYLQELGNDSFIINFEKWLIDEFETIELEITKKNVAEFNVNHIHQKLTEEINKKDGIGYKVELIKNYLNKKIETPRK